MSLREWLSNRGFLDIAGAAVDPALGVYQILNVPEEQLLYMFNIEYNEEKAKYLKEIKTMIQQEYTCIYGEDNSFSGYVKSIIPGRFLAHGVVISLSPTTSSNEANGGLIEASNSQVIKEAQNTDLLEGNNIENKGQLKGAIATTGNNNNEAVVTQGRSRNVTHFFLGSTISQSIEGDRGTGLFRSFSSPLLGKASQGQSTAVTEATIVLVPTGEQITHRFSPQDIVDGGVKIGNVVSVVIEVKPNSDQREVKLLKVQRRQTPLPSLGHTSDAKLDAKLMIGTGAGMPATSAVVGGGATSTLAGRESSSKEEPGIFPAESAWNGAKVTTPTNSRLTSEARSAGGSPSSPRSLFSDARSKMFPFKPVSSGQANGLMIASFDPPGYPEYVGAIDSVSEIGADSQGRFPQLRIPKEMEGDHEASPISAEFFQESTPIMSKESPSKQIDQRPFAVTRGFFDLRGDEPWAARCPPNECKDVEGTSDLCTDRMSVVRNCSCLLENIREPNEEKDKRALGTVKSEPNLYVLPSFVGGSAGIPHDPSEYLPREGIVFRNSIGSLSIRSMLGSLKNNIPSRQLFIGRVILILNGCGLMSLHVSKDLPFLSESDRRASLCRNFVPIPVVFSLSKATFIHSGNMKSVLELRGRQKTHELMRWDVKPKRGDKVSFNIIKHYSDNHSSRFHTGKGYSSPITPVTDQSPSSPFVLLATNISVVEFGSDRILELCTEPDIASEDYERTSSSGSGGSLVSAARELFVSNPELAVKPVSLLEVQKKYLGIVYSVKETEGEFGFIKCICRLENNMCVDKLRDADMYDGIANGLEVFFRKEHFVSPISPEASPNSSRSASNPSPTFGGKIRVGSVVTFKGAWVKERPQAHNIQMLMVGGEPLVLSDFLISGEVCLKYESMVVAAPKDLRVSKPMSKKFAQSLDYQLRVLTVQLMNELYYVIGPTSKLEVGDRICFTPRVDVSTHVQGVMRDPKEGEDQIVLCSKVSSL